jgi:hypothetical protein
MTRAMKMNSVSALLMSLMPASQAKYEARRAVCHAESRFWVLEMSCFVSFGWPILSDRRDMNITGTG